MPNGLGLSSVAGIVHQLGGQIELDTKTGEGSCFIVSLPSADAEATDEQPAEKQSQRVVPEKRQRHSGRILLAEDDAGMRRVLSSYLKAKGYDVVLASNGLVALTELEQNGPFNALISDILMPELGGLELLRRLRRQKLELPTILMSGYMDPAEAAEIRELHSSTVRFIAKPFSVETLARKLSELMATTDRGQQVRLPSLSLLQPSPAAREHALVNRYLDDPRVDLIAHRIGALFTRRS